MGRVRLPHERLADLWPRDLRGARLGAVVHPASVLPALTHLVDVLVRPGAPWRLAALFGPQHGILGHTQDNMVEWEGGVDPRYGVPVHSLYGAHRKPTPAMLEGLDALLVDLQDVGARYYTFVWTLLLVMEAAHERGLSVVVVDRPNPIGGREVEGPLLDPAYRSFVGLHDVPIRHGLTIAEMARLLAAERLPGLRLHTLPMEGWVRAMHADETGLPWVLPSPNMPTIETALVYPGTCLLEATTVSEGRGTCRPFEIVGAPWIDSARLKGDLDSLRLPGAVFRECGFQPTFHKGHGRLCRGIQIHVTDRAAYRPVRTGFAVIWALRRQGALAAPVEIDPFRPEGIPDAFAWKAPPYEYETARLPFDILAGHARWREMIDADRDPNEIAEAWRDDGRAWRERRRPFLLYADS